MNNRNGKFNDVRFKPLLSMGDFTVGTIFTQPLAANGRLRRLRFPVSLDEIWTNYPA
jgi:hypothetical protein